MFLAPLRLSRRILVGLAGTVLAAVEVGLDEVLAVPRETRRIFVLNPEWGAGNRGCGDTKLDAHKKGGGCHACVACHRHAKNKRFATRKAADKGRAHKHCRCKIEVRSVSNQEFKRMFGKPGSADFRKEFDLRW